MRCDPEIFSDAATDPNRSCRSIVIVFDTQRRQNARQSFTFSLAVLGEALLLMAFGSWRRASRPAVNSFTTWSVLLRNRPGAITQLDEYLRQWPVASTLLVWLIINLCVGSLRTLSFSS